MPELTSEQWSFLALLAAFAEPVPIEVVGILSPLLPGPLMDLLENAESKGLIKRPGRGLFAIGDRLPEAVLKKIRQVNSRERLTEVIEQIYQENLDTRISPEAMLHLLEKAGHDLVLAEKEIRAAHQALAENNQKKARQFLERAVERLAGSDDAKIQGLFVSTLLDLSNLSFSLGYGFQRIYRYLVQAQAVADQLGDRRSHALLSLHLGRVFYFTGRRDEALVALSLGYEEIEELDDEDIRGQAAAFLGIFHFIRGEFRAAIRHFEKAEQLLESEGRSILTTPAVPLFMGYCAVYLGQFHRAIGSLDYYWRLAEERGNTPLAATIRAILGTVLVLLGKDREALQHFEEARKDNSVNHFSLGPYMAGGGIALMHFFKGQIDESYRVIKETIEGGIQIGLVHQYSSPWILEMVNDFHRLGFDPLPDFEYEGVIERVWNGVNIHLKGVAWRLQAQAKLDRGEEDEAVRHDLAESLKLLEKSGDRVQQAKTLFVMAKLELKSQNRDASRHLVQRARRLLGGYADEIFPREFRHLMDQQDLAADRELRQQGILRDYLAMIESFHPGDSEHEIMVKVLNSTSSIFGAERSGLFWFHKGAEKAPELRVAYNLSRKEVAVESFRESMAMIFETRRTAQPRMGRLQSPAGVRAGRHPIRSALCIPIEVSDKVQGVLYFDNSYLNDAFDFLDPETMKDMMRHTNLVVDRHLKYLKVREERNLLVSEKSFQSEQDEVRILSRSEKVERILRQLDQIAVTDSTVMITGETGTGKELFARRVHRLSTRSKGPFIVVDAATIPDNLVESELFGHERGSFTGADRKKIGRIELAHQGTLFLDEIGELPLAAQAKLLRALQEKQFSRVGGTRVLSSDFRLVAATNRDLAREVAEGRFREDLYFRLNVIPIHLPPLRERLTDILLLAEHFLEFYARKYKRRRDLSLTAACRRKLTEYSWPGNIRELQNIMERAVLLSDEDQLEIDLPVAIQPHSVNDPFADLPTMDELQRRYISYVREKCGGKIGGPGGAAEILGLKRTSLYSRMKILGMTTGKG
jgi:transcriptional regulator with GAF, ATPase, and Fis domain/predicted negative regulator of RcsB-dependent stress response